MRKRFCREHVLISMSEYDTAISFSLSFLPFMKLPNSREKSTVHHFPGILHSGDDICVRSFIKVRVMCVRAPFTLTSRSSLFVLPLPMHKMVRNNYQFRCYSFSPSQLIFITSFDCQISLKNRFFTIWNYTYISDIITLFLFFFFYS